jgi:hypothetical protein
LHVCSQLYPQLSSRRLADGDRRRVRLRRHRRLGRQRRLDQDRAHRRHPGPGGLLGTNGFDVFAEQAVAARFTVPADGDMRLARIGLWLMNNSETEQRKIRLTVQTDALDEAGSQTMPSGVELERWTTTVQTLGWNPVEQFFLTRSGPLLQAGRSYWVVAASMSPPLVDPVWTFAKTGNMWTTTSSGGAWQTAGNGAALTLRVDAHPIKTP